MAHEQLSQGPIADSACSCLPVDPDMPRQPLCHRIQQHWHISSYLKGTRVMRSEKKTCTWVDGLYVTASSNTDTSETYPPCTNLSCCSQAFLSVNVHHRIDISVEQQIFGI